MRDVTAAAEAAARANEALAIAGVVMGTRFICCAWERGRCVPHDLSGVGITWRPRGSPEPERASFPKCDNVRMVNAGGT
jgi:hypothetical protein